MINFLEKIIKYLLLILLLSLIALVIYNLFDEEPHPWMKEFDEYASKEVPVEDNLYVFLMGVFAPETVKDFYQFGIDNIKASDDASKYEVGILGAKINTNKRGLSAIDLKIEKPLEDKISCMFDQNKVNDNCITLEEINSVIKNNKIIFKRILVHNKYKSFTANDPLTSFKYRDLININKVLMAKAILEARNGNVEKAYNLWRNNFILNKKILTGEKDSIFSAVAMASLSFHLTTIKEIIENYPSLISEKYKELKGLLTPISAENYDLKNILKNEYKIYYDFEKNMTKYTNPLLHLPNVFKNNLLKAHQEFYNIYLNHPSESAKYTDLLKAKMGLEPEGPLDLLTFKSPFSSVISKLASTGILGIEPLLYSAYRKQDYMRLINAYVDICYNNFKSEKDILEFLNSNKEIYSSLITGKTFTFDKENNSIYFLSPICQKNEKECKYNPERKEIHF